MTSNKVKELPYHELKKLQKDLSALGYYPYFLIDGLWGDLSTKAFGQFAIDHWLNNNKTGVIGPSYTNTLEEEVKKKKVTGLNPEIIEQVSKKWNYDPTLIQGFLEVESNGTAFWDNEVPPILYEAHIFFSETGGRWGNTNLSSRRWDRSLYSGGLPEYNRLFKACRLDYLAAFKSCSWGVGQVLGQNAESLGFRSVTLMVKEAHQDVGKQIEHILKFLEVNNIRGDLESENWVEVASRYNGPGHAQNGYAPKLAEAVSRIRST